MSIDKKAFGISDSLINAVKEALKGGQVKLDKNKNGKLDGQDFKMIRKEETVDELTGIHNTKRSTRKALGKIEIKNNDAASKAYSKNDIDTGEKYGDRADRAERYRDRLRKEEVEVVDEAQTKQQRAARAALATQGGAYDGGKKGGAINRMALMKASELRKIAGTKTKNLPMRKEEIEQVDELSKKTMGSYVKKALDTGSEKSVSNLASRGGYEMGSSASDNVDAGQKHDRKAVVRSKGIQRAVNKLTKEEIEQVDELSKKTMGSYVKKASHDVATKSAATGRYADRANAIKDQMKKGDYSNYQQGKKDDATADKMFNKSWKRRAGIAKATDKLTKEEVQIDEISKGTLASYGYKAGRQMQGNQPSDPDKFRKRTNREKGSKMAYSKFYGHVPDGYGHKVKVPATAEETDPGFAEAENPITKQLAAKRTEIQKTIAQKRMQIMQQKAQKTIAAMKESKCSCMEGKKSMTCETHGDKAMGMKGRKEQIQINPPLRD